MTIFMRFIQKLKNVKEMITVEQQEILAEGRLEHGSG